MLTPKASFEQTGNGDVQSITGIQQGWNLISLQILPQDTSPGSVLSGLSSGGNPVAVADAVESLYGFDAASHKWLNWIPGGDLNDVPGVGIRSINPFQGYWLKAKISNLTLSVQGDPPLDGRMVLNAGWNLVAFDGGSPAEDFLADVESVFGPFVDTVDPTSSRITTVYALRGSGQEPLIWDAYNDRSPDDTTPDLPPGNEPGTPNLDTLAAFSRGEGYWVHVSDGDPVVLQPVLRMILGADTDLPPVGNFPGAEDVDQDGDGNIDESTWTWPENEAATIQNSLLIPVEAQEREILIRNAGTGILHWRAHRNPGSNNWLSVSPQEGWVLRGTTRIAVHADRGALPGPATLEEIISVESSGGRRDVLVSLEIPDLDGDYIGTAQMVEVDGKSIQLPSIDLTLSIARAFDGTLRGLISAEDSLAIPLDIPLSGNNYKEGASDFTMAGSYQMDGSGRDVFDINDPNPLPGSFRRELRFIAAQTGENRIEGELQDTLHGVLNRPINITGEFALERASLKPSKLEGATVDWDPVGGTFGTETKRFPVVITDRIQVQSVQASISLTHPRMSDVEIWLEAPSQGGDPPIRVRLFNHTQGVDLDATFPDDMFPSDGADALDQFQGIIAQGTWYLEIRDTVDGPGETQRLVSFSIQITGPTVYFIEGTVVDDGTGDPLESAFVALTGGVFVPYTVTGPDGGFHFDFLDRGLYRITAGRFGFSAVESSNPGSLYVDQDITGLVLRLERNQPESAELFYFPRETVAPGRVTLAYRASAPPSPAYTFIMQKHDFATGSPVGNPIVMDSGDVPEAVFTGLDAGVYDVRVEPSDADPIEHSLAVIVRPTGALEVPDAPSDARFRMAGNFGIGGGVIPGVYTPPNLDPAFPPVSNVILNANMVDATTFDNDRLEGDGEFPVDSASNDPFVQVDTDVRLAAPIPRAHLSILGVARISYDLLQGERGGDLVFDTCRVEEGQTWQCHRIVSSIGATISGNSSGGPFTLTGGGRPFPADWAPEGGAQ